MATKSNVSFPLLLLAGLLMLLPVGRLAAAESTLDVEVSLQGHARVGQPVRLLVMLTNNGTAPRDLQLHSNWAEVDGLQLRVTSASGRSVVLPAPVALERQARRKEGPAMQLAPGQALGLRRTVVAGEVFNAPGVYSMVVVYRSADGVEIASEPVEVVVEA